MMGPTQPVYAWQQADIHDARVERIRNTAPKDVPAVICIVFTMCSSLRRKVEMLRRACQLGVQPYMLHTTQVLHAIDA
jgi:hypothetical protein